MARKAWMLCRTFFYAVGNEEFTYFSLTNLSKFKLTVEHSRSSNCTLELAAWIMLASEKSKTCPVSQEC